MMEVEVWRPQLVDTPRDSLKAVMAILEKGSVLDSTDCDVFRFELNRVDAIALKMLLAPKTSE